MKPLLLSMVMACSALTVWAFEFEDPADYPLMGDWQGAWINPRKGSEKAHPRLTAQLLPMKSGTYRVVILPDLYNRTKPYLSIEVPGTHERVEVKHGGFEVVFEGAKVSGQAMLHGDLTSFELKKVPLRSPTLGLAPPEDATVLFDGSGFDAWRHEDGKTVTWDRVGDAMQTVSRLKPANKAKGIGGTIRTRSTFGSMRFHMEFRYPVEAGKSGQGRGNSGLFLGTIGEVQILNSYTTPNYWDECGAFYKRIPAKVDAAGPPLEWQTYDVEIDMQENNTAIVTVQLNGRTLHHQIEMPCRSGEIPIGLQDHINILQYRNIWLLEK